MTVADLITALQQLPQHHTAAIRCTVGDADEEDYPVREVRQTTDHSGPWVVLIP